MDWLVDNCPTPTLPTQDVHLWVTTYAQLQERESSLRKFLSPEEQFRCEQSTVPQVCDQCVLSRGLLRYLIGFYLELSPNAVVLQTNRYGKPELKTQTPPLQFNVTHSGDVVAIGFSKTTAIGIDIEKIQPDIEADLLAPQVFSSQELKAFAQIPDRRKIVSFYEVWTKKEAYLKMLGVGLSLSPRSIQVFVTDPKYIRYAAVPMNFASIDTCYVKTWRPVLGYVASVALADDRHLQRVKTFKLNRETFSWLNRLGSPV